MVGWREKGSGRLKAHCRHRRGLGCDWRARLNISNDIIGIILEMMICIFIAMYSSCAVIGGINKMCINDAGFS